MADISQEINAIRSARYGEEVRGSIVDALNAVNDQVEDDTTSAGTSATNAAASAAEAAQTAEDLEDVLEEIQDVETSIETAEAARVTAEASRVDAEAARVTAEAERADAASGYVNQAREYANQAAQYASSDNALLSRSWAVGGTGTRYGEDSNNAKYWSDVAAQVVTEGGVASFNGRTGNVEPEAGDYSSSDITRGSGTVENSLTSIETQLGNIGTMDTANNTVTFTSGDVPDGDSSLASWSTVLPLASAETHGTLFGKISTMFKNIRYLWKLIGSTSMGTTATTLTGAIAEHEGDISTLNSKTTASITLSSNVTQSTAYTSICEKTGKMVTIYFGATANTAISSGTQIGTIPSGYRPPRAFRHIMYASGGTCCLEMKTNGEINAIGAISSGAAIIGVVTYQI